jgi:hypothetical protein
MDSIDISLDTNAGYNIGLDKFKNNDKLGEVYETRTWGAFLL